MRVVLFFEPGLRKQGVILDVEVTTGGVHDSNTLSALDEVPRVRGRSITITTFDAGYDVARVFAELEARRIEAIVPTRRQPFPKKGLFPPVGSNWMRDTIVSAVREAGILCRTATQMPRASKFIAQAFATARVSAASGLFQSKRPTPDDPSLLRARRRHLAWTERERILYASHRTRVEGVHGEEKAWHGLARAVRRGLANMKYKPT
jgi:hypothetical protein